MMKTPIQTHAEGSPEVDGGIVQTPEKARYEKALAYLAPQKLWASFGLILLSGTFVFGFITLKPIEDPWSQALASPCPAGKTCIIVAALKNDPKAVQTDHVISEIQKLFQDELGENTDITILMSPVKLDRQLISVNEAAKLAAEREARDWLNSQKADILIYGHVDKKAAHLQLSLLSKTIRPSENSTEDGAPPLVNELPLNFSDPISGVFLAALQNQGHRIVNDYSSPSSASYMHDLFERLTADMPEGLSPQTAAEIHLMYSLSAYETGEKHGRLDEVNLGIKHMQKAISLTSEVTEILEWAQKNYYLARMLETKHKIGQDTMSDQEKMKVLEHIINSYRAAQSNGILTDDLEKWGESQIRFSAALLNLGDFRRSEALIYESMTISQKALTVFSKDTPRHIKNRTSATLWYALALNRKGELSGDPVLSVNAQQILKDLHRYSLNQTEISNDMSEKLQNLITHLEESRSL